MLFYVSHLLATPSNYCYCTHIRTCIIICITYTYAHVQTNIQYVVDTCCRQAFSQKSLGATPAVHYRDQLFCSPTVCVGVCVCVCTESATKTKRPTTTTTTTTKNNNGYSYSVLFLLTSFNTHALFVVVVECIVMICKCLCDQFWMLFLQPCNCSLAATCCLSRSPANVVQLTYL